MAIAYFATAQIGQMFAIPPGNVTAVWIPSGIIIAVLLVRGNYLWPGIFIGAFFGNIWAYFDFENYSNIYESLISGSLNGTGDALGAVIGVLLFKKMMKGKEFFSCSANVIKFIIFAAFIPSLISALLGSFGLSVSHFITWEQLPTVFVTWLIGDLSGVVILTPALLSMKGWLSWNWLDKKKKTEFTLYVSAAIVWVTLLLTLGSSKYISIPLISTLGLSLWGAFRFPRHINHFFMILFSAGFIITHSNGFTLFQSYEGIIGLIEMQYFIILLNIIVLAVETNEIDRQSIQSSLLVRADELEYTQKCLDLASLVSETDIKGNITYVNDLFCEISKYSREELLGQNHRIVKSSEHTSSFYRDLWATISNGEVWSGEIKNTDKNGDFYWVHATIIPKIGKDNKIEKYTGIRRDITKIKIAEEKENKKVTGNLRASEEKYQTVVDSLSDGVVYQLSDGEIQTCNKSAVSILGLTRDQMMGRTAMDPRWHSIREDGSDFPGAEHPGQLSLATGKPYRNVIMGVRHTSGNLKWISINSSPLFQESKELPFGVVTSFTDITERKNLEQELLQTQKLDALGLLTGGIAHDFNNMLTAIIGALEFLELPEVKLDETSKNYVGIIRNTTENAAQLTKKLLAFGRIQNLLFENVSLHNAIDNAILVLERTLAKHSEITVELKAKNDIINGDNSTLENIIINLGINAFHAMSEKGLMTIKTQNVIVDRKFCKDNSIDVEVGDYIELEISDTGQGISSENLPHIFDPFFSTKDLGDGTGLGLSAVYGSVQELKGVISVTSKEGLGTSFKIYLPCSGDEKQTLVESSTDVAKGNGYILFVEDDSLVRTLWEKKIRLMGYTVAVASNGKEAVKIFEKEHEKIDLVFMDMLMPEMNGSEAFIEMKKIDNHCKVVIASGYSKNEKFDELKEQGLLGFIQKPYRGVDINRLINSILDK